MEGTVALPLGKGIKRVRGTVMEEEEVGECVMHWIGKW